MAIEGSLAIRCLGPVDVGSNLGNNRCAECDIGHEMTVHLELGRLKSANW